ncbi:hypothetical protein JCM8097_002120 [Rhodosporidiobolus ruineniae]
MPFISLPGAVRMHYEVLSEPSDPSSASLIDPSKPTLVALVPFYASQPSEVPQLAPSSPFRQSHNLIAISSRSHGRTSSEVKPQHDAFVSAADLAFAFEALSLPPSAIYGPGSICGRVALAFATLFPDLVTSLAVCGVSHREAMTTREGFKTLEASMFNPTDVDDLHEVMAELGLQLWGDHASTERLDDFINLLIRRYNPRSASKSFELCRLSYLSMHLTPEAVAKITAPVLFMHGQNDAYSNPEHALIWKEELINSVEVDAVVIPDAPHLVYYTHADEVLSDLTSFFARHTPSTPPAFSSPDFGSALRACAEMTSDPKLLLRNPRRAESFSVLTKEERDEAAEDLERIHRYEAAWRSKPLPPGAEGGEPWDEELAGRVARSRWRWSRRHDEAPTSDSTASSRFSAASSVRYSVASEVVVHVAPLEEAEEPATPVLGIVSSKVLPPLPASDENEDASDDEAPYYGPGSEYDSDTDEEGARGRKDSGFVDALEDVDGLDTAKQGGVVESMSQLALNRQALHGPGGRAVVA